MRTHHPGARPAVNEVRCRWFPALGNEAFVEWLRDEERALSA